MIVSDGYTAIRKAATMGSLVHGITERRDYRGNLMGVFLGPAHSWHEAYALNSDPGLFAHMQRFFHSRSWVQVGGPLPTYRDLGTLLNYWPPDGSPPDWRALLALTIPDPPQVELPDDGYQRLREGLALIEQLPGGNLFSFDKVDPKGAVQIDIVPLKPTLASGNESVVPIHYGGATRVVYAASWLVWAWCDMPGERRWQPGSMAILLRGLPFGLVDTAPVITYAAILAFLSVWVLTHNVPMTFSLPPT